MLRAMAVIPCRAAFLRRQRVDDPGRFDLGSSQEINAVLAGARHDPLTRCTDGPAHKDR
jgi:hypothetical protein